MALAYRSVSTQVPAPRRRDDRRRDPASTPPPPAAARAPARRASAAAGDIFDDDFWAGVDLVFTALDSVEARLFVDGICVARTLPLVDCGTLGAAGSVQPAVPCAPGADAGRRREPGPAVAVGRAAARAGRDRARGLGRRTPRVAQARDGELRRDG